MLCLTYTCCSRSLSLSRFKVLVGLIECYYTISDHVDKVKPYIKNYMKQTYVKYLCFSLIEPKLSTELRYCSILNYQNVIHVQSYTLVYIKYLCSKNIMTFFYKFVSVTIIFLLPSNIYHYWCSDKWWNFFASHLGASNMFALKKMSLCMMFAVVMTKKQSH